MSGVPKHGHRVFLGEIVMPLMLLVIFFAASGCLIRAGQEQTGQHQHVVLDDDAKVKKEGQNWIEDTLSSYHDLVGNRKVLVFVIKTLTYYPNKVHPMMRKYRAYTGEANHEPHDLHSGFYEVGLRQEENDVLHEDIQSKAQNYIRVRFTLAALRYLNDKDVCISDSTAASHPRLMRTPEALTLYLRGEGKNPGKDIVFVTSMTASKTPTGEIYFYLGRDNKLKIVASAFRINRANKVTATLQAQTFVTVNRDCTQVVEELSYVKEF